MNEVKPGDRVSFIVVDKDGKASTGFGVVTRYGSQGHPLIQPNVPLPPGARMANIQKTIGGKNGS